MCSCDLEQPSVFEETRRKARKEHRCNSCRGAIQAGEEYIATFGIWDGTPGRYKRCLDCDGLMAWAHTQNDCLCISVAAVMSDIRDHFADRGERDLIVECESRAKAIRDKRRQPVAA